jgi:hypothetical protein
MNAYEMLFDDDEIPNNFNASGWDFHRFYDETLSKSELFRMLLMTQYTEIDFFHSMTPGDTHE